MRLVGYVRVSRVAGREGASFISPDVQRSRIEAYALSQGHELVEVVQDLDESGGKSARPGFQTVLERVENGEAEGVIVAKADRFARSLIDALGAIRKIKDAGGEFVSVADNFDTSTPQGKLALTLFLAFAEFELDRIREGWDTAQAHAVARGIHVASRTPTGYVNGADGRLQPDRMAAPIIRQLFLYRAAGKTWGELSAFMDTTGIRGPYENKSWATGTLAKIIANPVYLGIARSGKYVNEDAHKPLVSRTEWEAAQSVRSGGSPRNGDGLLLAGLVRCAGCRYVVKADSMRDRDGTRLGLYRCRGKHPAGKCPSRASVLARVLEPHVEAAFLDALGPNGPLAEAVASNGGLEEAMQRVEAAEYELAAYRDEPGIVSTIGREAFLAGLETRQIALDKARKDLGEARNRSFLVPNVSGNLVETWPSLSVADKRALLTASIDAVFIRSVKGSGTNVPIQDRTLILWRGEAPDDLPRRGHRVPLSSFTWKEDEGEKGRVRNSLRRRLAGR